MKRIVKCVSLVIIAVLMLSACKPGGTNNRFTLCGEVESPEVTNVILQYWDFSLDKMVSDTSVVRNNKFKFENTLPEPVEADLFIDNIGSLTIYLEPSHMSVYIPEDIEAFTLTGSDTHDDHMELSKEKESLSALTKRAAQLSREMYQYMDYKRNNSDYTALRAFSNEIDNLRQRLVTEERRITKKYIASHPDSFISLMHFAVTMQAENLDDKIALFDNLSDRVKNSIQGQNLDFFLKREKASSTGMPAPDFTGYTIDGKTIRLSDYKGGYVLLDFWASWCIPCIAATPSVRLLAENFPDLQIITVSIDRDNEEWVASAREHYTMDWVHIRSTAISSLKDAIEKDDIVSKYHIGPIPLFILIDKSGVITGRWEGAGAATFEDINNILSGV